MSTAPALLRKGWPDHRVKERYLEHAQSIVDAGAEFRAFQVADRPPIERLLNERLVSDSPFTLAPEAGGIKATGGSGLIGVVVLEGIEVPDDGVAVRVTALAVTQEWERRGLGTVLLGMVPMFTEGIKFIYGGCAPSAAAFYQRAGYDVLQPGELLPFHLGNGLRLGSSNPHYPAWFVRYLR
jgi:GNAT superfamily N-acetyltransferase